MSADPVYWRILEQIQRSLQDIPDLTGMDDHPNIRESAIVIRRAPVGAKEWDTDEAMPGLILSPGRTVKIPLSEGDINTQRIFYPVLIQILDESDDRFSESQMKSQMKWADAVLDFLNLSNLQNKVFSPRGYADFAFIEDQDVFDERMWMLHRRCVFAMAMNVVVSRSVDARGTA